MQSVEAGQSYSLPGCFKVLEKAQSNYILDQPSLTSLSEHCQNLGKFLNNDAFRKLTRPWLEALCGGEEEKAVATVLGLLQIINPQVFPYRKAVMCLAEEIEKLSNQKKSRGYNPHEVLGKNLQAILTFPDHSRALQAEARKLYLTYPSCCETAQVKALLRGDDQAEFCWALAPGAVELGASTFYWQVQGEIRRQRLTGKPFPKLS